MFLVEFSCTGIIELFYPTVIFLGNSDIQNWKSPGDTCNDVYFVWCTICDLYYWCRILSEIGYFYSIHFACRQPCKQLCPCKNRMQMKSIRFCIFVLNDYYETMSS